MNENILQSFKSERAPFIKLLSLKRKSRLCFLKTNPSRFKLTSKWSISILLAHLLRAQTWENLDFRVGLNENANSFFATRCCFWSVKNVFFPSNGFTQSSTELTNPALNEIDQSTQISITQRVQLIDQSPQISVTQRVKLIDQSPQISATQRVKLIDQSPQISATQRVKLID